MGISKTKFGEYDGKEVFLYVLTNNNGMIAEIINYGGILRKLVYNNVDVVLGRDTMEEYLNNSGCYGALIGRNSNRIEGSEFELNGKIYKLYANNGRNNLHGGKIGFDKKVWDAQMTDGDEPSLTLSLFSPDGEEGFPGNLNVKVTYTLTADNALRIHYFAEGDADTVVNMTNHSYFNLNGHNGAPTDNHSVWLDADFYTPNTDECIPTGEVISVKGTPFDFSTDELLGSRYVSDNEQIKLFNGFDHNFALNGRGYRKVGSVYSDITDITMEVYTDQPGIQIYTANTEDLQRVCKDGSIYALHQGVCFETQTFPNNLKFTHFPSSILSKGDKYDSVTEFKFI